jgi:hypothetical protein
MKRIVIQVSEETASNLRVLAMRCTDEHRHHEGFTSHGELTVSKLLVMLAEDAAMVISRPGSWEGSNMAQVFQSHGYEI